MNAFHELVRLAQQVCAHCLTGRYCSINLKLLVDVHFVHRAQLLVDWAKLHHRKLIVAFALMMSRKVTRISKAKSPDLCLGWSSASLKLFELTNDALQFGLDRGQLRCDLLSAHVAVFLWYLKVLMASEG